jgi:hypothetical protein
LSEVKEVAELTTFKCDCLEHNSDIVTQKYLVDGASFFFNLYYNEHEEFTFKKAIAESLGVHIRDVAIVGSGKLGFSIKPEQDSPGLYLFKDFDFNYDKDQEEEKSDIDVGIISNSLFDEQLERIYNHTSCYSSSCGFSGQDKKSFSFYILKGWIKPETLPATYKISENIHEIQQMFSDKYGRDINIGIYKSWFYFEKYHQNNINSLMLNLLA